MGRIFLIRHGETVWNRANTFVGSTDMPLNDTGMMQARLVADFLRDREIGAVYSSGLGRARQTAGIIAEHFCVSVTPVPELNELDYGEWEGVPEAEVPVRYPEVYKEWRANPSGVRPPGGETFAELRDRAYPAFMRIAEENRHRDVVIVAHKSTNRMLLCCLMEMDINRYKQISQGNVAINVLNLREDGRMIVEHVNESCHLSPREQATGTLSAG